MTEEVPARVRAPDTVECAMTRVPQVTKPASTHKPDVLPLSQALLELVWPTRCAGCEAPGELLCPECRDSLLHIDHTTACPRCGAPYGRTICTECYAASGKQLFSFSQAVCALEMEAISGRMIVLYKDRNERRLADYYANLLFAAIPAVWFTWADCLSWIPSDKRSVRRRGFDSMRPIATRLAALGKVPPVALLRKAIVLDQRRLDREQRRQNLIGSFALTDAAIQDRYSRILLIDDVFTTGATLDSAAAVLLTQTAIEVRVATILRAW
ncbi:MAG: double zinc ribbon domain-containing protein [Coriobacteriales bacterium]|nr:double zinc ribbon domain-containing protein [Coriobacteriales bacterium]